MQLLNQNINTYSERLQDNLRDVPFAIHEHLLTEDSILRPKQKEAVSRISNRMFNENYRALALIMPTGTGKTVIISQILAGLKQDEDNQRSSKKIMIVSDSKEGIAQTKDKLKRYADIDAGAYYSNEKTLNENVTVTTYDSWQNKRFPFNPTDFDIVILDEAHKSITDARLSTLKSYDNAVWMALTASPTYSEEKDLLRYFDLGYRLKIQDAVANRLICGFRNVLLRTNIDLDLSELSLNSEGDYSEQSLAKAINKESRNGIAARYLLHGVHPYSNKPLRDIRGVISCVNVDHAKKVEEQFNASYNDAFPGNRFEQGFVRAIYGAAENRDDLLKWHREGKIGYLSYPTLLDQNHDDFGIGVCLNLAPARSKVKVIQRGGRTERLDPDNPDKIALIIDMLDSYQGEIKRKPLFYAEAIGYVAVNHPDLPDVPVVPGGGTWTPNDLDLSDILKDIDIITDEEEILSILHQFEEDNTQNKTDGNLTIDDLVHLTGQSRHKVSESIHKILNDWKTYDDDSETRYRPLIPIEKVRLENNKLANSIPLDKYDLYTQYYLPEKKIRSVAEDDLIYKDLMRMTGLGEGKIYSTFKIIKDEWERYEEDYSQANPLPVDYEVVKLENGSEAMSIKRSDFDDYKVRYAKPSGTRPQTTQDLMYVELMKRSGLSRPTIIESLKELRQDWEVYEADPKTNKKPEVSIEQVKTTKGKDVDSIPEDMYEKYKKIYLAGSIGKPKTDDHLDLDKLIALTGLSSSTIRTSLNKLSNDWQLHTTDNEKYPEPVIRDEMVTTQRGGARRAIPKDQLELYKENYLSDNFAEPQVKSDLICKDLSLITGMSEVVVQRRFKKMNKQFKDFLENPEENQKPNVIPTRVKRTTNQTVDAISIEQIDQYIHDYYPDIFNDFIKNKDTIMTSFFKNRPSFQDPKI